MPERVTAAPGIGRLDENKWSPVMHHTSFVGDGRSDIRSKLLPGRDTTDYCKIPRNQKCACRVDQCPRTSLDRDSRPESPRLREGSTINRLPSLELYVHYCARKNRSRQNCIQIIEYRKHRTAVSRPFFMANLPCSCISL